jgi:hypothetical protein
MFTAVIEAHSLKEICNESRPIATMSGPDIYALMAKAHQVICSPHAALKFNENEAITITINKE